VISFQLNEKISNLSHNWTENHIEDEGAFSLAETLTVNTTLTSLVLYCNCITVIGFSYFEESLKFNSTLTTLETDLDSSFDSVIEKKTTR